MSNYTYPYITEHFKEVYPNHPNCKNPLDFDKLAAYGAFDKENTVVGKPKDLKISFWRNIGRLCNYNDDDGEAHCLPINNKVSDNYKIVSGGIKCTDAINEYNNMKPEEKPAVIANPNSSYNLCGGGGSINIDDVKAGKIIVNRGNDNNYINDCFNEPLTITKATDRLKVSETSSKCQKLADKYLDTYKNDNESTRLFMKDEDNNNGIPGLVNVTEQDYNQFKGDWEGKFIRERDESLCRGQIATNINDYSASMNNHYVNQINNKETSLLNINKTMFNDPSGNNAIIGKGPTWLDMNFLSCDREDYEVLSIGERVKAKYINDHPFKSGWYGATIKNTKEKWNAVCRNPQEPCCGMGVIKPVDEKTAKQIEDEKKKIQNLIKEHTSKRNGNLFKPGFIQWKDRWERNKINGPGGNDTYTWKNSCPSGKECPNDYIPIPTYDEPVKTYVKTKESEIILVTVEMKDGEQQITDESNNNILVEDIDDNYTVKARDWVENDETKQKKILPVFQDNCKNYPITGYIPSIEAKNGGQEINDNFVKNVNKLFKTISNHDKAIYENYNKLNELNNIKIVQECKCETKKYRTNPELFNDIIDKDKQGCNEMLDGLQYSIQFDNEAGIDTTNNDNINPRWRTIDELKTGSSWYINNRNNIHKANKQIEQESGLIDNILKNDSDLDNTNLFTGFSDKLFGCKTKTRNINSERKTYTMDWNRLDDMGKLKYGFKGEDLHMKILSLTDKIKQKKNISTLFFTSFSIMLLYLIFKLKNKK